MSIEEMREWFEDYVIPLDLKVQCPPDGHVESEIALISEYPGINEVATRKPFMGGSGKLLFKHLRTIGLSRTDCYITNFSKRQVGAKTPLRIQEALMWRNALAEELLRLPNLKYIFAMGNSAMNALTGYDGIQKHRGSVYNTTIGERHVKIICAENPAMALRMPEREIIFALDCQKLGRVVNNDFHPVEINSLINPSYEEAMNYMEDIERNSREVAIDIEATGMETACIGLGVSETEAMCINFRDAFTNRYTVEEEYNLKRRFAAMTDNTNVRTIAQNGNFDSHFMGFKDHLPFRVDFDTLLAHHTLYPRLPHNLGFLTAQYTDQNFHKDEKDIYKEGGDIDGFWRYNCTDCCTTWAIKQKLHEELEEQGMAEFFYGHVMATTPHLIESTVTGILVDMDTKRRLHNELKPEIDRMFTKVLSAIRVATDDPNYEINLNSPKQRSVLFYDVLKLQGSSRSTDVKARKKWMDDPRTGSAAKLVITELNKYAEAHKFFSTYVETQIDGDNRFRAEFKQYGVAKAPGRLSSSKTLWGSGGNAQNQPARAFEMYVADEDTVWIYFDLAQAEARYVAWDAWIEKWMEDFERARLEGGYDAHRALASDMFNIPYDDVPVKDIDPETGKFTIRYISKRCRHGLNYRMQPARLAETTGLSFPEAVRNFRIYHATNPQLEVWWSDITREIKRKKMLFNAYGRRFIALEDLRGDSDIMDSIIAFKPQSTIGDKTQRVWRQCHNDDRWDRSKARIALNVHDALYGLADKDYAMTALKIMKEYAEEPVMVPRTRDGKVHSMIIPADCKMSVADEQGIHRMSNLKGIDV